MHSFRKEACALLRRYHSAHSVLLQQHNTNTLRSRAVLLAMQQIVSEMNWKPAACVLSMAVFCCAGAVQAQVTYPTLAAMVAYVQSRHAVLKSAASTARGAMDMTKSLPLPHKAYLALVTFLRECRSKQAEQADAPPQDYLGTSTAASACPPMGCKSATLILPQIVAYSQQHSMLKSWFPHAVCLIVRCRWHELAVARSPLMRAAEAGRLVCMSCRCCGARHGERCLLCTKPNVASRASVY